MQPRQIGQLTNCESQGFPNFYLRVASPFGALIFVLIFCSLAALLNCGGGGGGGSSNNNNNGNGGNPQPNVTLTGSVVAPQGNFSSGQANAIYTITVRNTGSTATSGAVTVTDPPTGFTVTAIDGSGWTCTLSTISCTRSDSLAAGQSYATITVTGNVTAANGTPVSIPLTLSGGGMASSVTVSPTPALTVAAPVLAVTETHTGNFNLGQHAATYTVSVKNGASAGATNAKVTVTETVPSGETLVSMSGTGWTCPGSGGANTCDRSDTLISAGSYPALTVTVNVAANAASPQVSQASVSGGGTAAAVSSNDSTTINTPDLSIAESHSGSFSDGSNGVFNISVSNVATGGTAGPSGGAITITDTLPAQYTFISAVANGWTCGAAGQVVTCTNSASINPGASAATIPLMVAVSATASGTISNTATVAGFGDGNAANNSSTDSVLFAPDMAIAETHSGNFGPGTNGAITLSVSNAGNSLTSGAITVSDTLPPELTFVSGNGSGWTCGAASQVVTCSNPGPIAAGASAANIPLIVAVGASASGQIANTAMVSTVGDTNAVNDSATDNLTVVALPESISANVPGAGAGGVIYAGGNSENVAITVANEGAGDVLSAALTLNGVACSTCGTLGSITGGSGSYTVSYTPPTTLAAATTVTLTVTSNIAGSFPATVNFGVFPANTRVVKVSGVGAGPGTKPVQARVFNDGAAPGPGLTIELLAGGYTCPSDGAGGTICGKLATVSTASLTTTAAAGTTGIPFTQVNLNYTPPANLPISPYDKPMILAFSNADNSKLAQVNFAIGPGFVLGGLIANPSRLNTALTGSAPFSIFTSLGGGTGVNKAIGFTLTANGTDCQPACGTLGTPTYTWNGNSVNATIPYTPPATVPAVPANNPVLTATSVDVINGNQQVDSVGFQVRDGACGSGNERILNGQYAFLLQGGGSTQGYGAFIGSFTADGSGNITGGSLDVNRTTGPITGLAIASAGSSYSIGPDNRGCLVLTNTSGSPATYRVSVGSLDGANHATKGQMVRFDDNTGFSQRVQGALMKQDATAFTNNAVTGKYVFGYKGIANGGTLLAVAGVATADGAGNLSNFDVDAGIGGTLTEDTSVTGTYSIDPTTGRGTATITSTSGTTNAVLYVVSSSQYLFMSTDPLGDATPILGGEGRKQSGAPFATTALDNNSYAYYLTGILGSSGGNSVVVGQAQFATNGAATLTQDENDSGTVTSGSTPATFTIASNGRTTVSLGAVMYLIGSDSAVLIGADGEFGFVEQQASSLTNASVSGSYVFSEQAPTIGSPFASGSIVADGVGGLVLSLDESSDGGLHSESQNFNYGVTSIPLGRLTITFQGNDIAAGYVISGSKAVLLPIGTNAGDAELVIVQK